ncbi:MAG: DNA adenine methylase [Anaerolineales bacterium]|nr:MAG: DNA adenine methylase [Anaerolineales bacterium]
MGYRYIGAKTKILPRILAKANSILPNGGQVIDLMAGTGAVSTEFRKNGFFVTACDLMTFSYHHCRTALLFTQEPQFQSAKKILSKNFTKQLSLFQTSNYEAVIDHLNNTKPIEGYFWREFSSEGSPTNGCSPRNYFSPSNAKRIDAIRKEIKTLFLNGLIDDLERSLLLHDLIMAANDVANIAGTYGHFLSVLRGRSLTDIKLSTTQLMILPDKGNHKVLQGYAEELAPDLQGDLCYIDPPYMKRQYAANYHILETLAREDEPEAVGVSGLRPWRDQYSNFCSKVKIRDAFSSIINNMRCDRYLISYSDEGLLTIDELFDYLSKFGRVTLSKFAYKRFKSRAEESRPEITEYLIDLRRHK